MTVRVLLVDDDPSVRLFAAMALAPMGADLVECGDTAQALASHQAAPAHVIVCGAWPASHEPLPGFLTAAPAERQGRPAVLIALVDPSDEALAARLRPHAWSILPRPCALPDLEQCLQDAVALVTHVPPHPTPEREVIATYFEGDTALYRAFLDASRQQFMADVIQGDRAVAQEDVQGLRRLGHSLKTVLQSLGHDALGRSAARLERHAESGQVHAAAEEWGRLSAALRAMF